MAAAVLIRAAPVKLDQQIPVAVAAAAAVTRPRRLLAAVAAPVGMSAKFLSVPVSLLKLIQLAQAAPLVVAQQPVVLGP